MNTNYVGIYWLLNVSPIWVTALVLYMVTIGVIFILRDHCEGLYYNTSYSAMLGDGALMVAVLIAVGILQRGASVHGGAFSAGVFFSVLLGIVWFFLDNPQQWGDRYHHLVIAPLFCYLGITLLPVIFMNGTSLEITATVNLVVLWAGLVVYDAKTKRLNQRKYMKVRGIVPSK